MWQKDSPPNSAKFVLKKISEYCGRMFPFRLYFWHFDGVWLSHGSSLALASS
jgi:hypothetical protein